MSYAEKPEDITKEEWMDKLNNVHIQRADMNRLIMNYLVTGEEPRFIGCKISYVEINRIQEEIQLSMLFLMHLPVCLSLLYTSRGVQRGCREVQDGVWDRAKCGSGLSG